MTNSKFYKTPSGVFYTTNSGIEKKISLELSEWVILNKNYNNDLNGWADYEVERELTLLLSDEQRENLCYIKRVSEICTWIDESGENGDVFWHHVINNENKISISSKIHREKFILSDGSARIDEKNPFTSGARSAVISKIIEEQWTEVRYMNGELVWVLKRFPNKAIKCDGKEIIINAKINLKTKK